MKVLLAALGAAALAASVSPVSAQPGPTLRLINGVPRADAAVPPGAISVRVSRPAITQSERLTDADGTPYVRVSGISAPRDQTFSMTLRGLAAPPAAKPGRTKESKP